MRFPAGKDPGASAHIHGMSTFPADLSEAWLDGAAELRDWDGKANLSNNPYL